jgi:hypothetical protein
MSADYSAGYRIEYYAADELRSSDDHPGPLHKTESWAINGMIKYLFSSVVQALILDGLGEEVNEFRTAAQSQGQG